MAGTLVIFKRIRPSKDVAFYQPSGTLQAQVDMEKLTAGTSQTVIGNGLVQIRTVYFFTVGDYTAWSSSPGVAAIAQARTQYHTDNGITEFKEVVNLTLV